MRLSSMRMIAGKRVLGLAAAGLFSSCGTQNLIPTSTGSEPSADAVTAAAKTQREFQEYWANQRQLKENGAPAEAKPEPEPKPEPVATAQADSDVAPRATVSQWWAARKAEKAQAEPVTAAPPVAAAAPEVKEKKSGGWWGSGKKAEPNADTDLSGIDLSGDFPTARSVEDWDGFVRSPYNNRFVDVKGVASGTLVADPRFDISERKFFIVP